MTPYLKYMKQTRMVLPAAVLFLSCVAVVTAQEECDNSFRVTITKRLGLTCGDCDGVALGDISGDGKVDILASNGKGGTVFWFEQGDSMWEWTKHGVFEIESRPREIEGNDLGDLTGDGRLEAISLDQPNGVLYLHRQGSDIRSPWKTVALLRDRPYLQASLVTDVDGDGREDLIYTWEGNAPGHGGVHWLTFSGTDPLNPEDWSDHVMVSHEAAWWLAPKRADLNGNGRTTDVAFTARKMTSRNAAAKPGLFWLEEPADVTGRWRVHTIDRSLHHPTHVTWGDFSGDGHGYDLAVSGSSGTMQISWYQRSADWKRHDIPLPKLSNGARPNHVWGVKGFSYGGPRDGILSTLMEGRRGAFVIFEYVDGLYRANELLEIDYAHPMDDRIILADLDGDKRTEAIIPDSGVGVDRLWIVKYDYPLTQ